MDSRVQEFQMRPVARDLPHSGLSVPFRQNWLDLCKEEPIDQSLPIVDAHHHFHDRQLSRYLFENLVDDIFSSHRIVATVFVECGLMYRANGPSYLRSLGEVEVANGAAAMSASGVYGDSRICAGIVGHVDLRIGPNVSEALDKMRMAAGRRFRGIRQVSSWDEDTSIQNPQLNRPRHLLIDSDFQKGFTALSERNLTFDAFLFYPQLSELTALAKAFPDTTIILDHLGGPIGVGRYEGHRRRAFHEWSTALRDVAQCQNVFVKIGGLGMRYVGFGFETCDHPPSSRELATAWKPYIETTIKLFGPHRCMFESNFPRDRATSSYTALWNAFKIVTSGASKVERELLFNRTACNVYGLELNEQTEIFADDL
jgi:L-fuconolactonase